MIICFGVLRIIQFDYFC